MTIYKLSIRQSIERETEIYISSDALPEELDAEIQNNKKMCLSELGKRALIEWRELENTTYLDVEEAEVPVPKVKIELYPNGPEIVSIKIARLKKS